MVVNPLVSLPPPPRLFWCVFGVFSWIFLFGMGTSIGTTPYRSALATGDLSWYLVPWYVLVVIFCYSLTNIGILCCVAAVAGGACNSKENEPHQDLIARGLFVYLVLMSGVLVIEGTPFAQITPDGYIRQATTASLMAFVMGYFPELFRGALDRVRSRYDSQVSVVDRQVVSTAAPDGRTRTVETTREVTGKDQVVEGGTPA